MSYLMCIDLLTEKFLKGIKKKHKWYERDTFLTNFTVGYIGITITAQ